MNIIKKSGSWFSYGETKLGQGRDAVRNLLEDNQELMDELEGLIKQAIAGPVNDPALVEEVTEA
jgi:recombination protein RecA